MVQASASLSHPIAVDYDKTLVLAIELSSASWVLAAQVPGLPRVKAKQSIEPTAEALLAAVDRYRDRARAAGKTVQRVGSAGRRDVRHPTLQCSGRPPGAAGQIRRHRC